MEDYKDASLTLADYRRRVQTIYAGVRAGADRPEEAWQVWQAERENLFAGHPQSALSEAQRADFVPLAYYDYDPAWRLTVEVETAEAEVFEVPLQADGLFRMRRVGQVRFDVNGEACRLSLFWVEGYGGGLFLPFRDTSWKEGATYPGSRYLLDTIKGADLGMEGSKLVLDFNFAYNPSCAYHYRWHCPLAPQENWLEAAVPAGEQDYPGKVEGEGVEG